MYSWFFLIQHNHFALHSYLFLIILFQIAQELVTLYIRSIQLLRFCQAGHCLVFHAHLHQAFGLAQVESSTPGGASDAFVELGQSMLKIFSIKKGDSPHVENTGQLEVQILIFPIYLVGWLVVS